MINGAVIGSPISHSLSPVLHKAAFDFLGIDGNYKAIEVKLGSLSEFFTERSREFDYFSITMPLKEEALEIGITPNELTTRIQSANTLYKVDGSWKITSTDGSGMVSALSHAGIHHLTSVLILGAGGTARAVAGSLDSISVFSQI